MRFHAGRYTADTRVSLLPRGMKTAVSRYEPTTNATFPCIAVKISLTELSEKSVDGEKNEREIKTYVRSYRYWHRNKNKFDVYICRCMYTITITIIPTDMTF